MRIGLLTGGGDAPGLNGVIEATSRTLLVNKVEVVGICDGFEGVFGGNVMEINTRNIQGIHCQAGTFIGTSNKSGIEGREKEFLKKYESLGLDGLIVAGGDGTFRSLAQVKGKLKIIGVPKTIDNDLPGTETTFGYDTACSVVCEAVDSLRATALAHKRVIVVEVMGRTAGWIAIGGGMASYADAIFIPELKFDAEKFRKFLAAKKKTERGLVIVVSEGVSMGGTVTRKKDKSGASVVVQDYGVGHRMSRWIESELGWESRPVVLGHLQRARAPTTTDRFLTTAMGIKAARLALGKKWNQAVIYKQGRVTSTSIQDIMGAPRLVEKDHRWVEMAKALGIFVS